MIAAMGYSKEYEQVLIAVDVVWQLIESAQTLRFTRKYPPDRLAETLQAQFDNLRRQGVSAVTFVVDPRRRLRTTPLPRSLERLAELPEAEGSARGHILTVRTPPTRHQQREMITSSGRPKDITYPILVTGGVYKTGPAVLFHLNPVSYGNRVAYTVPLECVTDLRFPVVPIPPPWISGRPRS